MAQGRGDTRGRRLLPALAVGAGRGGAGAAEDMQAVERVSEFIAAHGASRFERVDGDAPVDQKVINRAGFKRREGGEWEFLILPATFRKEVCR
jgi:hypothetical protein